MHRLRWMQLATPKLMPCTCRRALSTAVSSDLQPSVSSHTSNAATSLLDRNVAPSASADVSQAIEPLGKGLSSFRSRFSPTLPSSPPPPRDARSNRSPGTHTPPKRSIRGKLTAGLTRTQAKAKLEASRNSTPRSKKSAKEAGDTAMLPHGAERRTGTSPPVTIKDKTKEVQQSLAMRFEARNRLEVLRRLRSLEGEAMRSGTPLEQAVIGWAFRRVQKRTFTPWPSVSPLHRAHLVGEISGSPAEPVSERHQQWAQQAVRTLTSKARWTSPESSTDLEAHAKSCYEEGISTVNEAVSQDKSKNLALVVAAILERQPLFRKRLAASGYSSPSGAKQMPPHLAKEANWARMQAPAIRSLLAGQIRLSSSLSHLASTISEILPSRLISRLAQIDADLKVPEDTETIPPSTDLPQPLPDVGRNEVPENGFSPALRAAESRSRAQQKSNPSIALKDPPSSRRPVFAHPTRPTTFPLTVSSELNNISPLLPPGPTVAIAKLAHGLDRVLFNPGVHFLRDPRTGVYNFSSPMLEKLPTVDQFEFEKMPRYITASKDETLETLARENGKKFVGSTSSTTAMLCQIYFWLSGGKRVNLGMLSEHWRSQADTFSMGQQLPASVILHERNGHYAIDADKSMDLGNSTNVLSEYGHLMEKLLTSEPDEFKRFLVGSDDPAPSQAEDRQAYYYMQTDNLILRSQLDAHHDLLPNVSFDLKTRGTVAIRQDRLNYEANAGYEIDRLRGEWNSFEREYYDLIRSAFLKYQFQARIGHMDGILVAHHTTAAFCGFAYIPIAEMDEALFHSPHGDRSAGDNIFHACVALLDHFLIAATDAYPGRSLKITFAASADDSVAEPLRLFVEPIEKDETLPAMTLLEVHSKEAWSFEERSDEESAWSFDYAIKMHTTPVPIDTPSSEAISTPSVDIARLLSKTREFQQMFNSIALPENVSLKELKSAQEAAKMASAQGLELKETDLAMRFPAIEGYSYRSRPSKMTQKLRSKAGEGRLRLERADKGLTTPRFEVRSVIYRSDD